MPNIFLHFSSDIIRIRRELVDNLDLLEVDKYRKFAIKAVTQDGFKQIEILEKLIELCQGRAVSIKDNITNLNNQTAKNLLLIEIPKNQSLPSEFKKLWFSQLRGNISETGKKLAEQKIKLKENQDIIVKYNQDLKKILKSKEYIESLLFNARNINISQGIEVVRAITQYFKYEISYLAIHAVEYIYSKKDKNATIYPRLDNLLFKRIAKTELRIDELIDLISNPTIDTLDNYFLKLRPFIVTNQKDIYFDLFLFITIRQTVPHELKQLLNYQKSIFKSDFKAYIKTYLPVHTAMINESHITIINDWLNEEVQTDLISEIDFRPVFKDIPKSNITPPEGFRLIPIGTKTQEDIKHFFSFLCSETNGDDKPFMSKEDVEEMLQFGFGIYEKPRKYYEIGFQKDVGIIKYCFYNLYLYLGSISKPEITLFLIQNFTDFKFMLDDNLINQIRGRKPQRIGFEIRDYLINK
jgi:hypothetical protein